MTLSSSTLPACEAPDTARDDAPDIRDLIPTAPLVYDVDGLPVGYDARQLFGLGAANLGGRA